MNDPNWLEKLVIEAKKRREALPERSRPSAPKTAPWNPVTYRDTPENQARDCGGY